MDDILRAEAEVYLAVGRDDEFGCDEVIGGVGIRGVEADWVALARGDQLGMSGAEGGVKTGVAEVPRKLHTGDFDLERSGIGSGVAGGGPEAFGVQGECGEEES